MWFFWPNQRAHWWSMKWNLIWGYFNLFSFMLCSMISCLLWLPFVPGSCSMHGLWERGFESSYELLQRYMFSRFRCLQRAELIRRVFRCFNDFGLHRCCFFLRRPIWWEWTIIWWVEFYYEDQEWFSWLNDTFHNLLISCLCVEEIFN